MLDVRKTVRTDLPAIPYQKIASFVLGPKYELSLVICGDVLARRVNVTHRNKSYSPNVLSFELDKHEGEIFLNLRKAEREARRYGISVKQRLALLYVHGLFHLKGMDHSDRMERMEQQTLRKFGLD